MNGNAELLNFIYQNSQMGIETLHKIMGLTEDKKFHKRLESQYKEYEKINKISEKLLNTHGYDEKGISTFEKMRTYLMINLQMITDKSTSHIAEMLIIGSNMGVIDAIKNLKKYHNGVEKEITELMDRLLTFEEDNIKELKEFL